MKILIIDNYDSFTYNLFHYVEEFVSRPVVVRSDSFKLDFVEKFDGIILSPGPGLPSAAGLMPQVIKKYYKTKRILGICLGHQAIVEAFGGKLKNLGNVLHGVAVETYLKTDSSYSLYGKKNALPLPVKYALDAKIDSAISISSLNLLSCSIAGS
jgi:anthranilate synthase component 2